MTKEAHIKCPHCGGGFIVRQVDGDLSSEQRRKIWAAADEAFKAIDTAMDKAFAAIKGMKSRL